MPSYLSRVYYEAVDGATTNFTIPFPYLLKDHVFIYTQVVDADPVLQTVDVDYEWPSSGLITFFVAPVAGLTVFARRSTPNDDLLDRLTAPSTLNAAEQNTISTQLLYLIQEALDSGISLEVDDFGTVIRSILTDLRWNLDVSLSGFDIFDVDDVVGPVPITRTAYFPTGASGASALAIPAPASNHIFNIQKHSGGVTTVVGTLTVTATTGAITWSVVADVAFAIGDAISLKTTTAGGLTNFGATVRLRRTDS